MPKSQGFCIYCGGSGLTKEHIFPNWLKAYIPRTRSTNARNYSLLGPGGKLLKTDLKRRQGDPHTQQLRVVCKACNGGWMGRLQEQVKPILVPMLTNQEILLYRKHQTILARWAAMTVMTMDFAPPGDNAISQDERTYVVAHNRPPSNWRIWIGRYKREAWPSHWVRNTIPIKNISHLPERTADGLPRPNSQSTTFVVGQVYVTVISSVIPNLARKWHFGVRSESLLRQIWPLREPVIDWPPAITITDDDADRIAHAWFGKVSKVLPVIG